jgi:hypothetical protein
MVDAPLIITPEVLADLHKLRDVAARKPVSIPELMRVIKTPRGERMHRERMTAQTVLIPGPWEFFVTFSIETGHPSGTCRHMSMSIMRDKRVPHPAAIWMVAAELGFSGGLEACKVWPEDLSDRGVAINLIQPLSVQQAAHA